MVLFGVYFVQGIASLLRKEGGLESTMPDTLDTNLVFEALKKGFQDSTFHQRSSESYYPYAEIQKIFGHLVAM